MAKEVENFNGCYCLVSTNPLYKGRTYIGYTVDPKRRVGQHNKGSKFGGAYRTSGKGPWDMVLIIFGFPNEITALRDDDTMLTCLYPSCKAEYHMTCLSKCFLKHEPDQLLPVEGSCPSCKETVLWGDLIRKKQGCYANLAEISEDGESDHWAEELRSTDTA
nr:structure-specific endonuclease subunit slx1-like isoform X2 [Lytechinus pictus]